MINQRRPFCKKWKQKQITPKHLKVESTSCVDWPFWTASSVQPIKHHQNLMLGWWLFWWEVSAPLSLKHLPHSEQECGLSLVWLLMCLSQFPLSEKHFPHSEQTKGFSPVWTLWCLLSCDLSVKDFPHSEHEKGFSLVCDLWWRISSWLVTKDFLHSEQE